MQSSHHDGSRPPSWSTTKPNTPVGKQQTFNSRGSTTEPNTPAGEEQNADPELAHCGDFARLVPHGRLARLAFSEVVDGIKDQSLPAWTVNAERFIHIGPRVAVDDAGLSYSSSDLEGVPTQQPEIWSGWFRLNMEIPPHIPRLGWIAGRGRTDRGVDLLLCRQQKYNVSGRHARFFHNHASGAFVVHSDGRKVVLDGREEISNTRRALTKRTTGISFGDLTYTLVYTDLNEALYKRQLEDARRSSSTPGAGSYPPFSLTPTPSVTDYEVGSYTVKTLIAEGSTCRVYSAIDRRTGDAFAMKTIVQNPRNEKKVRKEKEILDSLKPPHSRICRLVEVISAGSNARSRLADVFFVFRPLARSHLGHLISDDLTNECRINILYQCIDGLAYIHEKKLMHRDIKPGNIGVVTTNPPAIILLDFGIATYDEESRDHMAGTVQYLAPEILDLKHNKSTKPYNNAADIWSLGVTAHQLISRRLNTWKEAEHELYVQACRHLTDLSRNAELYYVVELIKRLMEWNPNARLTAEKAFLHKAFSHIEPTNPDSVQDGRLKRSWEKG